MNQDAEVAIYCGWDDTCSQWASDVVTDKEKDKLYHGGDPIWYDEDKDFVIIKG